MHLVSAHAVSGVLHYEIAHEDRATTLFVDGAPRVVRPLRSHAMTYEPAARWLAITTDCMEAVTPLATIAGAVFFGRPRHFLDTPAIDLWKLQELGAAALSVRELAGKVTVSAINATWQSGKPHTVTLHGPDFFKALDRYKIRIEGGGLDLFTLRGKLPANDGGPAQCDVVLRPPHLLSMSEPEAAPLMREFLDYAHITNPETAASPRDAVGAGNRQAGRGSNERTAFGAVRGTRGHVDLCDSRVQLRCAGLADERAA